MQNNDFLNIFSPKNWVICNIKISLKFNISHVGIYLYCMSFIFLSFDKI